MTVDELAKAVPDVRIHKLCFPHHLSDTASNIMLHYLHTDGVLYIILHNAKYDNRT